MEEEKIQDIYRKIKREETLINGARAMRQSTDNVAVQQGLDNQVRESQRNLGYLEQKVKELEDRVSVRKSTQAMANLSVSEGELDTVW